jgi:tRNA(Ile)-lysidine synthase
MDETRRLNQLRQRLLEHIRFPEGRPVVALSGGADSAALAYLLADSHRDRRALHVDHGLAASPHLEKAARQVAERTDMSLSVLKIEVPPGASFEGQAREQRYGALLGALVPDEVLLTGHTLDDQAETVVMNLLRGAGPTGLAGIPARTGDIARPMLQVSRSEARELAGLAGLPYYDDPSNLDPGLRRNAIRLEVIPTLAGRFNPRLVESLARTASLLQSDEEHLATEVSSVQVVELATGLALPIGSLTAVSRPIADRVIRGCLSRLRPPYGGTSAELAEIWEVAGRLRTAALLGGGVEVSHDGPLLVFSLAAGAQEAGSSAPLEVGTNQVGSFEILVDRLEGPCRVFPIGTWSAVFPDDIALEARVEDGGRLVVLADHEPAWLPGVRRLPVAWYRPGASGYLSVFAREESGWTSRP